MDTSCQIMLLWKSCQVEFGTFLGTPPDDNENSQFDLDFDLEGQLSQVRSWWRRLGMDTRYQIGLLWKSCQVEFGTLLGTPPDYKEQSHFDLDFDLEGKLSQVRSL